MSNLLIPCPKCGSNLKLRDPSLLGRRGKCPKCGHGFVMQEPEEVQLELAEAAPVLGQSAQWVPDKAPARATATSAPVATAAAPDFGGFAPVAADTGGNRIREIRQRNARRRNASIAVGGVLALLIGGSLFAFRSYLQEPPAPPSTGKPKPTVNLAAQAQTEELQSNVSAAADLSPTKGEPISLKGVPGGATILFHLHPAQLWDESDQITEIRYALGPVATWAEAKIKEICLYEPKEIEEALISINLLSRGMEPEVAAVVRLKEAMQPADLLTRAPAAVPTFPVEGGPKVFAGADRAYVRHDERTFSTILPGGVVQAEALASSHGGSGSTSDPALEQILAQTDRTRLMTVVFPPEQTRIHLESLVPELARTFFNRMCLWFGDDVEAVAWSIHLGPEQLYSQFVLRNRTVSTGDLVVRPIRLERELRQKLDQLPTDLYSAALKMKPKQLGTRQLIGRFPAMVAAFSMGTLGGIGDRYVQLTTVLPERAAPNLAIGALLAWDESTRTDFTQEATLPTAGPKLPETVAGRLQQKIDIDFRRTPLEEAFRYIFDETKVGFTIDGDALKAAGFTKNMPQDYQLGVVPATEGLKAILSKYAVEKDPIVVVIDEAKKSAHVTTQSDAEKKGLKPAKF